MNKKQQTLLVTILMVVILLVDQIVKMTVKTQMYIGQDIPLIGEWCRLHFIENEGFAFGMNFGGATGKVLLTLFRLFASAGILWYLIHAIRKGMRTSLALCVSLILVGAVGNLIDSCFYGLIFSESGFNIATMFPPEGGYAPLLQGKVVDMFYFPLFEFDWPDWMPLWGGRHFLFFSAIFNVADAAITIGAIWFIVDQLWLSAKGKKDDSLQN